MHVTVTSVDEFMKLLQSETVSTVDRQRYDRCAKIKYDKLKPVAIHVTITTIRYIAKRVLSRASYYPSQTETHR